MAYNDQKFCPICQTEMICTKTPYPLAGQLMEINIRCPYKHYYYDYSYGQHEIKVLSSYWRYSDYDDHEVHKRIIREVQRVIREESESHPHA